MIEYIQIGLLMTILIAVLWPKRARRRQQTDALILDSSALIDGRIMEVSKTGFIPGKLIVPEFIVHELQLLADGHDAHKRERARFGLDVVKLLQDELGDRVVLVSGMQTETSKTDDKLVALAKEVSAGICTTDYNLNKVATINGIRVYNLNELSQAVRPVALPGERHTIKLVQKGSSKDQGVGYLEDGTMVVVSGAGNMIGKKVDVDVTRMLQTEAGKMIFAKRVATKSNRR